MFPLFTGHRSYVHHSMSNYKVALKVRGGGLLVCLPKHYPSPELDLAKTTRSLVQHVQDNQPYTVIIQTHIWEVM